jgi:hypothetical protein
MNPRATQYRGPDADDGEISAFRELSHAEQFTKIQWVLKCEEWGILSKLIIRTKCVQEGLLCFLPSRLDRCRVVIKRWKTGIETMLAKFNQLSDQEKAARILQAEELGEHDFLAFLTLETDCVLHGFINDFPKLLPSSQKNACISWRKQRALALRRFNNSSNQERLKCLTRIVSLQLWRALSDLVRFGRIGLLGFPGEMPEAISPKWKSPERKTYSSWEAQIAQAVTEFGNLMPDKKETRLTEALIFQQTRFIRELLRVSMDGFGRFADWMPSAVLKDEDVDAKWMRLRLTELLKSSNPRVARIHRMQKLRSEPQDDVVAGDDEILLLESPGDLNRSD